MKSRRVLRLVCTLLVLLLAIGGVTPILAYPTHTDYLSDTADVLDDGTERSFKELASELKSERHVTLALCTVQSTGGEELDSYASALFSSWEVGHGLLILIVTESDSYYAVPSRSLEEYMPSDKLASVVNTSMETYIAQKDYSGAVTALGRSLSSYITENVPKDFGIQKTYMPTALKVILIIIVVLALLLIAGYIALVYLERRNAQRQRMLRELRRRGGAVPPRHSSGSGRTPAYNDRTPSRPQQLHQGGAGYPNSRTNAQMNPTRRPADNRYLNDSRHPNDSRAQYAQGQRRAASGNGQYAQQTRQAAPRRDSAYRNMQSVAYPTDLSANSNVNAPRRAANEDIYDKAATVQISTADIRAHRGGRSKFYDGTQ